jgi:hypothetical protein
MNERVEPHLRALLNLAAANTSRADQNSAHIAANLSADFLQIRIPAPLGFVVGVTDVVADRRMLLAVCAMSHWISDLSEMILVASQISPYVITVEEGAARSRLVPLLFIPSEASS